MAEKVKKEKKERTANFSLAEEVQLLRLVLDRKEVIESKATDAQTNESKEKAWDDVQKGFAVASPALVVSRLSFCVVCVIQIDVFFFRQPRSKKSLQLKYKNLKKFVKDKVAAHKRGVMGTGGGSGPGELTFKHPIFMELYEAIRLTVDGHPPRYDNDDNDDAVASLEPTNAVEVPNDAIEVIEEDFNLDSDFIMEENYLDNVEGES